jgi:hypothetical protein
MTTIIFSDLYASNYITDEKKKCGVCKKCYSRSYNLKYKENDSTLVDTESKEPIHLCRKCMIVNSIDTKVKYRCECCHSFYKSKCMKCEKDQRMKNYVLDKIKVLLSKINSKPDLVEIKKEIEKY